MRNGSEALNEPLNFRIFRLRRLELDSPLPHSIGASGDEPFDRFQPTAICDDVIVKKSEHASVGSADRFIDDGGFAGPLDFDDRNRNGKIVCYALQNFPSLVFRVIIRHDNLRPNAIEPVELSHAVKQSLNHARAVLCRNNDS